MRQAFTLGVLVLFLGLLAGCGETGQALTANQSGVGGAAEAGTEKAVSVREIKENPERFRDRPVRIRGYGTIVATVPLCPGYVGLDTRCRFVDEAKDMIVARVSDELDQSGGAIFKEGDLRLFRGYVRIFDGEIGCPGNLRRESFPWLEIVAVE
ncbi:MAG: hypothetical protein ACPLPT_09550 [Moorellales bacterium]